MRKIQRQAKAREGAPSEPVKALWKSSKYEGVESRVRSDLQVRLRSAKGQINLWI